MSGEKKTPYTKHFSVLIAVPGGESTFSMCAVEMARAVGSHGRPAGQEDFLAISCLCAFPKLLRGKTPVADSEPEGCACTEALLAQRWTRKAPNEGEGR